MRREIEKILENDKKFQIKYKRENERKKISHGIFYL